MIGQLVGGRYEIVRLIGKGGMGAIYEIRNTRLGRSFAMKTLIGEAAEDAEVLSRFRREADVVARIKHPNIVEVVDWEALDDGSPCIILEYLQGEDLSRRVREAAPMPWMFIAKIGDQILSALSVAHAAGIVHRDLKPQNIFLALDDSGEERAKLLDFGVSKIRDSRSLVTTDARLLGTPAYMSPEQAEGRHDDVGAATDIWAMGAILYEMATGEMAFDGASMPAVLYKICSKDAEDVTSLRADVPPAFAQLVRETLTRPLDQRITDADVLRVRLREALADVAPLVRYSDRVVAARPTPSPMLVTTPTSPTPSRRKRHTGAHDATISGGHAATAPTVASGSFDKPPPPTPTGIGQISTSTLPPPPRRSGALLVAIGTVAMSMIVIAIILATSRDGSRSQTSPEQRAPVPVSKPTEPVLAIVDAGVPVAIAPDAAVEITKPAVQQHGTVKRDPPKKSDPPKLDSPPRVDPPKLDPPKLDPPKKCDPKAKDYQMCLYGQGGGL